MKRAPCAALLAAAISFGCAGSRSESSAPPAQRRPTPAASPPAPPAAAAEELDEYARIIDRALSHVAAVRELAPKARVKGAVISREELLRRIRDDLLKDLEPEVIEGTTELLFALNLTRADFDYVQSLLLLFGTQLAGFYDPRAKEMVLLDDLGVDGQEATLWHELVHALQDQHYDLGRLIKWSPERGDALAAIQGLAEGDATSAMLDVMLLSSGQRATDVSESLIRKGMAMIEALPEVSRVPGILKRSIVAPYTDGIAFTHALRREGGWSAVDAAWREPPTTTEQLLHPEKYRSREAAAVLPAPPPPPGGPSVVRYRDVLGEQTLRLVLEEWVPIETAARAAADWGGDRVAVFVDGRQRAVAVRLRYDNEAAAKRGFDAIARGSTVSELESAPSGPTARPSAPLANGAGRLCRERSMRGPFATVRVGRDLGVTLGPYRRDGASSHSGASCGTSLTWAEQVARAP